MRNYIIRRLIQTLVLLVFISALIFIILQLVPGGPFDALRFSNPKITAAHIERLNALLGLNKPIHERYLDWLSNVLRGHWGTSWTTAPGRTVTQLILYRLPYTLLLMGLSTFLAVAIAVPIGIYSAVRQYSWVDYLVTALSFFGTSMPTFWFGIMMIITFSVTLGWFPTSGVATSQIGGDITDVISRVVTLGRTHPDIAGKELTIFIDGLQHLIMPATVLSLFSMAQWSRFSRSSMLEVLRQDYMRTARSKGVRERVVILKHGLRNALIPIITIMAIDIPTLFTGAIVTETIFSWPGMGRLFFDALNHVDWPVVQGILVMTAILVVFSNLLADVLYAVVDPRIQYS
jgi:peptide/nickel transport system permease protein